MIPGFFLNKYGLLECETCNSTFNDEAEAEEHISMYT